MARILRWGAGYSGEDPHHILVSVDEADEVQMDRWTILLDAQDITEDGKDNGYLEPPKVCSKTSKNNSADLKNSKKIFNVSVNDKPTKVSRVLENV